MPSLRFNVQSAMLALPFWTPSCHLSASTSNPPCLLFPFGLPRAFPPLQRPIRTLARPFWTSAYLPSASMSNSPCLLILFGLPRAFPLLQRPICRACSSLLDFLIPSLCFNVQSATQHRPFWTSSCLPSASTSNPPCLLVPFGLPRAVSPL